MRADIEAFNKERSGSSDNLRPNGASSASNKHQSAIVFPTAFNQQSPKHTLTDARPLEELLDKGEGRHFNSLMAMKHRSAVVGNDVLVSSFLQQTLEMAGLEPEDDGKKLEVFSDESDFDTEYTKKKE